MSDHAAYRPSAVLMHWVSALLIAAGFTLGLVMTDIPGLSPTKLKYFSWHKWIGITVFLTVVLRIALRLRHRAPPLPAGMGRWQRHAAHGVHIALYGLLLAVPLSGLLYSQAAGVPVLYLGVWRIPTLVAPDPQWKAALKVLHWTLNYTLLALVGLHVLAALKHQFVDRDNLLARMLPFLRRPAAPPSQETRP